MFAIVSVVKYFWKNRSDFIALCRLRHCTSIVEHVRTFQLRMYDLVLLSARSHTSHLRISIKRPTFEGSIIMEENVDCCDGGRTFFIW